jgi:hypothetical protein
MIAGRTKLFALAFAAATGGPYLASMTGVTGDGARSKPEQQAALAAAAHSTSGNLPVSPSPGPSGTGESQIPLEGAPVRDLSEIFRFDIGSGWVMARWARVFTQSPQDGLRGYRVPLVTGTAEHDLAGSLTYYFDKEQRVQRITFIGACGDTGPLVTLMTSKFKLERQLASDPGLHVYQIKDGGRAVSELRIEPMPVVLASQPHSRFKIHLWLERPAEEFKMFSHDPNAYTSRGW